MRAFVRACVRACMCVQSDKLTVFERKGDRQRDRDTGRNREIQSDRKTLRGRPLSYFQLKRIGYCPGCGRWNRVNIEGPQDTIHGQRTKLSR